jgi:hypothetical protein
MAAKLEARVLDLGLNVLYTEADAIYLTSAQATTYTEATATYALGNKTGAAGSIFGAPADASPNGRKVTSNAISDGDVTGSDTATYLAVVDTANTRLLMVDTITPSQVVTSGNTFSLAAFDVRLPAQ